MRCLWPLSSGSTLPGNFAAPSLRSRQRHIRRRAPGRFRTRRRTIGYPSDLRYVMFRDRPYTGALAGNILLRYTKQLRQAFARYTRPRDPRAQFMGGHLLSVSVDPQSGYASNSPLVPLWPRRSRLASDSFDIGVKRDPATRARNASVWHTPTGALGRSLTLNGLCLPAVSIAQFVFTSV